MKTGPTNTRVFGQMVKQALVQEDYAALREIVAVLVKDAKAGDKEAIKILADRMDGKAAQDVHVSGEDGAPLGITVNLVRPAT